MPDNIKYCHIRIGDERSFFYDHVHIAPNENITFHQDTEWELSYIIKGSGTRIIGDVVEPFSSGEVVFLPPNIPHCWTFNEYDHDEEGKVENITIILPVSLLEKCAFVFPETGPYLLQINQYKEAVKFEGDTLQALQEIMTAMLPQNDIERLSSLIHLFFLMASSRETHIVGFCNKQNKSMSRMQEVTRFMVNNYQRRITLDDVAKYVGMNRSSFCVFFKRMKGKSFFSVLNEYRIESSCLMLRETSVPIAGICYAVGFNDVPYYNRTFKKLKGETPKAYRSKQKLEKLSP